MENHTQSSNEHGNNGSASQEVALATRYPDIVRIQQPEFQDEADHGGLIEYWNVIRRYKGTVIIIAFFGAMLGFLFTLPQTPIYQARASIEIENLNQSFMKFNEVNPTQTGMGGSEVSDIQTQIRILQSDTLIERVVTKLKSPAALRTGEGRISAWKKALNLPQLPAADAYQQSLTTASSSLKVRAAGQTRIIELLVDSTDPNTAAEFANTLATEYIENNLESRWKTTEKTTEWLTRQLDGMRVNLEHSEDRLQQYAREAGLVFMDEKTNVSSERLRQLQQSLSEAQAERITKQSRFEMAKESPPEALPDILNDAALRAYTAKLTELRGQIVELTSTYTAAYPKVKRAEDQYKVIESAFNHERGAILKRIGNEYYEAMRRESLLAKDYAQQTTKVTGEGERAIQYNILKREVDSNRQLYDTMLQQLKQANIAAALRASNVRIIDPAKVPRRPYKPDPVQTSLIGLMAGLVLGVGFVVMRERADRSIKEPGEAPGYLNIPELGVIPSASFEAKRRLGLLKDDERVELAMWLQKPSILSEAFRSTLISILFSAQNGARPRVFLITSASPGEGKSTTVSNLAIAIAEVGQRVLLIDADLRKPRIHGIFGVESSPGLTDLLSATGDLEGSELTASAVRETQVPRLFILTAGKSTTAATSLLYGPRLPQIVKELSKQFDTILIDSPPMLQLPDARLLGRMSDRVILVMRSGKTTRDAAIAAFLKFKADGTQVLGTILNDWNPKLSTNGYYGYYGKYYREYSKGYSKKKPD